MKRNYEAPGFRLVDLESDESILKSSYIDITDKPVDNPATNEKDLWGNEDIWK